MEDTEKTTPIEEVIAASRQDPSMVDASGEDPRKDVWRRIKDVFGADYEGALAAASSWADDINRYHKRLAGRRTAFDAKQQKARAAIAKIEARIAALEADALKACASIQESIDTRMDRLDEFRQDYAAPLHLKRAKSVVFPAGTFTFHSGKTRDDFAKGEDGKRDDVALTAWVNSLYDLGLVDVWDMLMPAGERKIDATLLRGGLEIDEAGNPWFVRILPEPLPEKLAARIADEEDKAHAKTEKTGDGGEILSWLVHIPAVYVELTPDGTPIRTTKLYCKTSPEDRGEPAYTTGFEPAEEVP